MRARMTCIDGHRGHVITSQPNTLALVVIHARMHVGPPLVIDQMAYSLASVTRYPSHCATINQS